MCRNQAVVAILGSAFSTSIVDAWGLQQIPMYTPWGPVDLYRYPHPHPQPKRPAYVLFRHGQPHRWLPQQIPYRAHAWALAAAHCGALLITSSVGVLDKTLPLNRLLEISDILMPDNRLPDGTQCTMFEHRGMRDAHLVLHEGLLSHPLRDLVRGLAESLNTSVGSAVFGYAPGPRTKSAAENRLWRTFGAQVNSMTLAPEVVLANELEIPCAGIVVGHKYSNPDRQNPESVAGVRSSLEDSRQLLQDLVRIFLERAAPVPFGNLLYRFEENTAF